MGWKPKAQYLIWRALILLDRRFGISFLRLRKILLEPFLVARQLRVDDVIFLVLRFLQEQREENGDDNHFKRLANQDVLRHGHEHGYQPFLLLFGVKAQSVQKCEKPSDDRRGKTQKPTDIHEPPREQTVQLPLFLFLGFFCFH